MGNDWLLIGFAAFVLTGTGLAAALAAGERKSLPIAVQAWAAAVALALLAAYVAATVVSDGAAPVLSRVAGGDLTGLFAGAVVFGSLVPLVCAVPSRGRLLPAACGFISIAAGAVLLQWTVQCLGLPAWQFFAR